LPKIESEAGRAQVIYPSQGGADGRVVFGATLELEDLISGAKFKYQIVGDRRIGL